MANETTSSLISDNQITEDKLSAILIEIRDLNERVKKLWLAEALKESQLPVEIIQPIIEERFKKKRLNRPLLEGEIKDALSKTKTMAEAARYVGVHFDTFKKYCELYDKSKVGGSENLSAGGTAPPSLWRPTRGSRAIKNITNAYPKATGSIDLL